MMPALCTFCSTQRSHGGDAGGRDTTASTRSIGSREGVWGGVWGGASDPNLGGEQAEEGRTLSQRLRRSAATYADDPIPTKACKSEISVSSHIHSFVYPLCGGSVPFRINHAHGGNCEAEGRGKFPSVESVIQCSRRVGLVLLTAWRPVWYFLMQWNDLVQDKFTWSRDVTKELEQSYTSLGASNLDNYDVRKLSQIVRAWFKNRVMAECIVQGWEGQRLYRESYMRDE